MPCRPNGEGDQNRKEAHQQMEASAIDDRGITEIGQQIPPLTECAGDESGLSKHHVCTRMLTDAVDRGASVSERFHQLSTNRDRPI